MPILESVLRTGKSHCARRIDFLLAAKQDEEIDFYIQRLHGFIERAKEVGIQLLVSVAVTCRLPSNTTGTTSTTLASLSNVSSLESAAVLNEISEKTSEARPVDVEKAAASPLRKETSRASIDSHVCFTSTRPDVKAFIRSSVEATGGETSVVVCGGPSLVANVRNCVAALSDERAVHKGTGAQGIHLHVEEYCL
jgi:hypothetical protein